MDTSQLSYSSKIELSNKKVINHAIATKIRDLMKDLRLNGGEKSARRWIWELLQNAKDAGYPDELVEIEVNLNTEHNNRHLIFKHSGRPFTVENITFLIKQVSNKSGGETSTNGEPSMTGKFGTGFLTTHLLSEVVNVSGVVKEPDLPYRKINLVLDRSGRELDAIIESVDRSLKSLESIDHQNESLPFRKGKLNTAFRYQLNDYGVQVASKGLDDLELLLPYSLIFLNRIKTVKVPSSFLEYKLASNPHHIHEKIFIFTVVKDEEIWGEKTYDFAVLRKNTTSIAIPVKRDNNQIALAEIDDSTPRIFCDFPLIGTENFPFPVIVNNPLFNCTEPRDNIYLKQPAFGTDPSVDENQAILEEAMDLYFELLEFASKNNWGNMYVLAQGLNKTSSIGLLSSDWLETTIIETIRNRVMTTPIVDTIGGTRAPFRDENGKAKVRFLTSRHEETLKGTWELCSLFIPEKIPRWQDIKIWQNIIWSNCPKIDTKLLAGWIESQTDIDSLAKRIPEDIDVYKWLNAFLGVLSKDKKYCSEIEANVAVFPNQNGEFRLKDTLFWEEEGTDETLKDIIELLGGNVRDTLLSREIYYQAPLNRTIGLSKIASQVQSFVEKNRSNFPRSENTKLAFNKLLIWFNKNKELANQILPTLLTYRHRLLDDNEIIDNLQKAEELNELMGEFEVENISDLRVLLQKKNSQEKGEEGLTEFTKEIVASLGVTTLEEFKEALRDKDLAQLFAHTSTPTVEMLQYAQQIIARAKSRVLNHLSTLKHFDLSECEEIAPTVFAGIKKHGIDIYLVVRPSDNGEVILYYTAEKDTLDYENTELWVDNGIDTPKHISFGKLLKDTGINRFSIT